MKLHALAYLLFASVASTSAQAQSTFVALKNGDVIPGYGTVNGISFNDLPVEIADDGTWSYMATLTTPQGNKGVLLRGGVVYSAQGGPTPGIPASTIGGIGFASIDSRGEIVADLAFSKPNNNGEGIFRGGHVIVQRDQVVVAAGWPANTTYADLNGVELSRSNQILLAGQCAPGGNPQVSGFLSVLSLDAQNNLSGESLVARTGAQLAGQPAAIYSLSSWPGQQSINTAGQVIYSAGLLPSGPGADGAVMLWNNGTSSVLARDGQPSAVAGMTWLGSSSAQCAIGDNHWAFLGGLNDFRTVIVRDGAAFKVKGQPFALSGAGGEILGYITFSNRCMSASGALAWYAGTIPSHSGNEGVFVDNQLVFQKDVTPVGGTTANQMMQSAGSLAISPNGRFVALKCSLAPNVTYAIVIVDRFGGATTECAGDGSGTACPCGNFGAQGHGCANSANAAGALLSASGVASVSNDSLVLTSSSMPNTPVIFLQGLAAQNAGAGVVFGDGLLCTTSPTIRLGAKVASGGTAQYPGLGNTSISVRGQVPAIGGTRIYQAWFRDNAAFCTASHFNVSNAISVLWMP
ncbi:MAG TPA: hypothetical protein VK843_08175 [Planctomycetota bacterium]|nr:hypothetical protein [Planctomycetota bacterium]